MATIHLDDIDVNIIKILQEDARLSLRELAKLINVSVPTISSHVKRLEDSGVIQGYRAIIFLGESKANIRALIEVNLYVQTDTDFLLYLENSVCVNECNFMTGDFSYHIHASFETVDELNIFVSFIQKNYGKTRVSIELEKKIKKEEV